MQQPKRIPFTKAGYKEIHERYSLLQTKRSEVLVRLQAAREMGDLSENGAYKAARWELGGIDRELRKLTYLTRLAYVPTHTVTENIGFGSIVTVKKDNVEVEYQLVNAHESNPAESKISVESPLGVKLMGKKVGDVVELSLPSGIVRYEIVNKR